MNEEVEKLLRDYTETYKDVQNERLQRQKVINTEEYQKLQDQKDEIEAQQDKLLAKVPDSTEDMEMLKEQLTRRLEELRITDIEGYAIKTRVKKSVVPSRVLHALGGDIDEFVLLTSVTQKALTEYTNQHPELKRPFKSCIEIESEKVTDILPLE